jgi:hypothetical protein
MSFSAPVTVGTVAEPTDGSGGLIVGASRAALAFLEADLAFPAPLGLPLLLVESPVFAVFDDWGVEPEESEVSKAFLRDI